jgi:hypothetical protein
MKQRVSASHAGKPFPCPTIHEVRNEEEIKARGFPGEEGRKEGRHS